MDFQILQNFQINVNQHWGAETLDHDEYNTLPLAYLNRFQRATKCCDLSLLASKKVDDQNQFIVIQGNTKKVVKQQVISKPKIYQQLKNQQGNRYTSYPSFNNKQNKARMNQYRSKQTNKTKFKDSITVKNNWIQIRDIVKSNFDNENIKEKDVVLEVLKQVGHLKALDPQIEKIQRREFKLNFKDHKLYQKLTSDDQYIQQLVTQALNNPNNKKKVFCRENFLTALMTLKISQYPWHIKINKSGNIILLDNFQSETNAVNFLDLFSVNQNTQNNMPQQSRIMQNCIKATKITKSFKEQLVSGQVIYEAEEQQQNQQDNLVRYVKITIQKNLEIYTRAVVDGAKQKINQQGQIDIQKFLVRSLVETETVYEWKKKFETTAGQVISQQYLANNCNWQKWMIQAYLSGATKVKAGYISQMKQGVYNILNVSEITPKQIQKNITFKIHECWSVIKFILQAIFQEQDGEYVLLKSPYQSTVKLYFIPDAEEQEQNNNL